MGTPRPHTKAGVSQTNYGRLLTGTALRSERTFEKGWLFGLIPVRVRAHADQTPDLILQACPMCTEKRQQTWPNSVDLATKLESEERWIESFPAGWLDLRHH